MIGRFVVSKAGHDKGTVYVVAACEGESLYLADGRLKKADAPKKKNRKHVQLTNSGVEPQLREALAGKCPHLDDRIKYAIKQYRAMTCEVEGIYVEK